MCEKDFDDCHTDSLGSKNDVVNRDAIQESSDLLNEHKSSSNSASHSIDSEVEPSILEESTRIVEDQGRQARRSITLEEAANTILLCRSIVRSLASGCYYSNQ